MSEVIDFSKIRKKRDEAKAKASNVIDFTSIVSAKSSIVQTMDDEDTLEEILNGAISTVLMSLEEDGIDSENPLLLNKMYMVKTVLRDILKLAHGGTISPLLIKLQMMCTD